MDEDWALENALFPWLDTDVMADHVMEDPVDDHWIEDWENDLQGDGDA